jgi:23S rRNA pseudouridine1911/1915/1917 synthase
MKKSTLISGARAGQRLDRALEVLLPESGLRARRRMIESGRVLLDGAACGPACKVRQGQRLELLEIGPGRGDAPEERRIVLVERQGDFAVVRKPAGLHSATLAGGGGASAEEQLPGIFPGEAPLLLNRLDQGTSGLLLVGLAPDAEARFRALEAEGRVEKEYLAVALGTVEGAVLMNRLDTADRKRTRVLRETDPDPARWTRVEPLGGFERSPKAGEAIAEAGLTLLRVVIRRGARHQIRAHLAGTGHPLLGDALYGGPAAERLHLHHRRIRIEDGQGVFEAVSEPEW